MGTGSRIRSDESESGEPAKNATHTLKAAPKRNRFHVLLIPGLSSHRDVWAGVAETLDDRYRLHLVQVNGFAGFAPGANASGPVSAPVVEDVARYIRDSGLARPAVIGHSMGGTIGMMLAVCHPESLGRLMVVDVTPFMGDDVRSRGCHAGGLAIGGRPNARHDSRTTC